MRRSTLTNFLCLLLLLVVQPTARGIVAQQAGTGELHWYKGNTHTHTKNSDGDSPPAEVVGWYKENGYDFLVITDHEHITAVDELNMQFGDGGKFLVVQGQEVTDRLDKKPYHVNGLGLGRVVMPQHGTDIVSNLQKNIDAIRAAGAVPQINHPNFGWAITAKELMQVQHASLMEIYSGHPIVNMLGGGGVPSVEEMWDTLLTGGKVIYGVAVDDVHHLKRLGDSSAATPGHGWVVVRARELTPSAILSALDRGDFYASSGVELEDYEVTKQHVLVKIKTKGLTKYRTQFIGGGGKLLHESITPISTYRFKTKDKYVRVRVLDSNGSMAWTQPVFVSKR